ncbi:MAG: DUF1704 domain-containing protein [Flavobacteriaceae bacterium]|nr:DUF1704 domain-containing protein [Flavobacteriaceae bacterium]
MAQTLLTSSNIFLNEGQTEVESVRSAQRIFRGGAVKDKIVFTKDAVYLQGLVEVHTFLRVAIRDNRPELVEQPFCRQTQYGRRPAFGSLISIRLVKSANLYACMGF